MNLNDLETFVLVAEAGTFTEAANRLGVPKSTVSRRVSRLEEDLGIALLVRSSRSIALSDDGRALADRCTPAIRELERIERGLGDTAELPQGRLRITTPIDFGLSELFTDLVAAYSIMFEEVDVEVEVTNRFVDLLEEGFDVAFRIHSGSMADRDDLVVRRLTSLPLNFYASPAYLERCGTPERFEDLGDHTLVRHSTAYAEQWPGAAAVAVNDYGPVASIVAAGTGIGGVPAYVAAPYVARGTLVELDLPYDVPTASLSMVWLRSRHLAPRVRGFIDLAAERVTEERVA